MNLLQFRQLFILCVIVLSVSGCAAATEQIIPTARPTEAPTVTPRPSNTPERLPTASPTPVPLGAPTATPLFGPSPTPSGNETPTPPLILNPNAPRIEFFQSGAVSIAPGGTVTLFWSTRNATTAVVYQLDRQGERARLWNVSPAGNLSVRTSEQDRGQVDFVLSIGEPGQRVEQTLSVPLECPVQWFFSPPPLECADTSPQETFLIEQRFERGRMLFNGTTNEVIVLFNDGFDPAWIAFSNQYDPSRHPEFDENFAPPPGFYQPVARLGFLWRGNDTVRNRLGLGVEPELAFDGITQTATLFGGVDSLYISSTDGTVLQLIGTGSSWQIITPN